jgi:hypothetical protein
MFDRTLTHQGHVRQFSIREVGFEGWEVREARDSRVVRQINYTDWHRVERALAAFSLEVATLEERGWQRADT